MKVKANMYSIDKHNHSNFLLKKLYEFPYEKKKHITFKTIFEI